MKLRSKWHVAPGSGTVTRGRRRRHRSHCSESGGGLPATQKSTQELETWTKAARGSKNTNGLQRLAPQMEMRVGSALPGTTKGPQEGVL